VSTAKALPERVTLTYVDSAEPTTPLFPSPLKPGIPVPATVVRNPTCRYLPYSIVSGVRYIDVPSPFRRDPTRQREGCGCGGTPFRQKLSPAGKGADRARRRDHPYSLIVLVRNIKVARLIQRDAIGIVELGRGSCPAVASVACDTVAGDSCDGAVRNLADSMIAVVQLSKPRQRHQQQFRLPSSTWPNVRLARPRYNQISRFQRMR
jgi:hypothetical protein